MTTNFDRRPLLELTTAAAKAAETLGLRYRPVVVRDERTAHSIADRRKGHAVMLGDGAYWVVCLADAARLERAGYEFAHRA